MDFCAAILLLKMEENTQHFRSIISRKATEMQNTICAVYEGAVNNQTCQKWFAKFCAGNFWLGDAPQLGRPVEVNSNQIETLIENDQHYATWEIADIFKISKSIKL